MYKKAYGIIETLAPLHVGASAGEETGNLNLIFRDQFTQTGIIPGSSIRGRFRADMRQNIGADKSGECYGKEAKTGESDSTTESLVKFEYASLLWLPVFCPGQPVVWVTCPRLLRRYQQTVKGHVDLPADLPQAYTASQNIQGRDINNNQKILFFNLGFLTVTPAKDLEKWMPTGTGANADNSVVVGDNDIAMIHDMALYRQSRVKLDSEQKKVDGKAFFNVEALPEGSILVFPIALKKDGWQPFKEPTHSEDLYFGGLESIGFGRCHVTLGGDI
jgi:CRISPR-associated protein Cmr4